VIDLCYHCRSPRLSRCVSRVLFVLILFYYRSLLLFVSLCPTTYLVHHVADRAQFKPDHIMAKHTAPACHGNAAPPRRLSETCVSVCMAPSLPGGVRAFSTYWLAGLNMALVCSCTQPCALNSSIFNAAAYFRVRGLQNPQKLSLAKSATLAKTKN
jgi:hypothetical protein